MLPEHVQQEDSQQTLRIADVEWVPKPPGSQSRARGRCLPGSTLGTTWDFVMVMAHSEAHKVLNVVLWLGGHGFVHKKNGE